MALHLKFLMTQWTDSQATLPLKKSILKSAIFRHIDSY